MSLLDDWQTQDSGQLPFDYPDASGSGDATGLQEDLDDSLFGSSSPRAPSDLPIFSLDVLERNIARGRGQVTAVAAASDIVAVATSRGWLLCYDFSQGPAPITEVELSKAADAQATGVWMDASATHCFVALRTAAGPETHYMHAKWKKARSLPKLKGAHVTCLAWHPKDVTETSTGQVALGTEAGTVIELVMEEKEKKERGGKVILDLSAMGEPVRGMQQLPLPKGRLLVLLTTPKRLYAFAGPDGLEAALAGYRDSSGLGNFVELPTEFPSGQLACYSSPGAIRPQRFAWLAGPGLYRGALDLGQEEIPPSELDYLADHNLLPLPLSPGLLDHPLAVAQTEYHEVLLYSGRLHMVNRVSQSLVQEVPLLGRRPSGPGIQPLGFAPDPSSGTLYLYTGDALLEVVSRDEERDMWRIYLDRSDYANAFRRCRNQGQRDVANNAEATAAFAAGRLLTAARLWGKVTAVPPSFEETALKFVEAGDPDALQAFLLTKLDTLAPGDKAQATMVATWLAELYLDRINRAVLEEGEAGDGVQELTAQLRDFLKERVELLDMRTTMTLLASYGRLDDLMHYASYRQDNEAVLEHLVQRGDAKRALAILRRPDVSHELLYKFAPRLMAIAPAEVVDAWMGANPPLDPRRLLPALLRYADAESPPACRTHVQRYMHFCVQRLQSTDPAVHQLAVALYCSESDDYTLMEYLATARDPLGKPLYAPQAALRLARQHKRLRACVELLWELTLFEESVALALSFDMQQAVALANRPQEDEVLQRKLWLAIACHLISTAAAQPDGTPGESIKKINEFMRDAGGLIKIEDILPLFPDFVQIDNFKEAICQSLEDYNSQIANLKSEMDDATRIADALRRDMAALEQRRATLDLSEPCARCGCAVGGSPPASAGPSGGAVPPYFLFPSGNAFHGTCLAVEVMDLVAPQQQSRIKSLLSRLSKVREGADTAPAVGDTPAAKVSELQAKFREEVASEDPYNGELVIRNIDKPFILESEADEVSSWKI